MIANFEIFKVYGMGVDCRAICLHASHLPHPSGSSFVSMVFLIFSVISVISSFIKGFIVMVLLVLWSI